MRLILHTTSMSKELVSNMRFKNQVSSKKLTAKKRGKLNSNSSLLAIIQIFIALLIVPISLKASFNLMCLFSETGSSNKTLFYCNH